MKAILAQALYPKVALPDPGMARQILLTTS